MFEIIFICKENNKYYPISNSNYGLYVLPSELTSVIKDLTNYCNHYTDEEIKIINAEKQEHFFDDCRCSKHKGRKRNKGFIYVCRCANNYKIGFAEDVERRIKQLDVRPFKLELIFKIYSDRAYDIEQQLHQKLKDYSLIGEWYAEFKIDEFKALITEIAEDLKCDIQY